MSTSEAVNVFLRQVILKGGLPFDVRLPIYNDETIAAFEEAIKLSHSNDKSFTNTKELVDTVLEEYFVDSVYGTRGDDSWFESEDNKKTFE